MTPLAPILVVDDEPDVRNVLGRILERAGYMWAEAGSVGEGTRRWDERPYSLLLCDVDMPGGSGMDVVRHVRAGDPEAPVVIVTGLDRPDVVSHALTLRVYGYLTKPFSSTQVRVSVEGALHRAALERENREHRTRLEEHVSRRTAELQGAVARLEDLSAELAGSRREIVLRLVRALELRDGTAGGHVDRFGRLCRLTAERLGLPIHRAELLALAGPMHDVGKIALPDRILLKPGPLTAEERTEMERHAEIGRDLLAGSDSELLELAAEIALTHHERVDGRGYPRCLSGERIPLEGRIVAVCDVWTALTSDRVYRPAIPHREAIEMLRAGRGNQFDAEVLDAFLAVVAELEAPELTLG